MQRRILARPQHNQRPFRSWPRCHNSLHTIHLHQRERDKGYIQSPHSNIRQTCHHSDGTAHRLLRRVDGLRKRRNVFAIPRLTLVANFVRFFHDGLRFFKLRIRNADLERSLRTYVKERVRSTKRLVRDSFVAQQFAKFSVNPWIIPLPERAEGIFLRFSRIVTFDDSDGRRRQFHNKVDVAIRAPPKPFPILRFANRAEHVDENQLYYSASIYLALPPNSQFGALRGATPNRLCP